MNRERVTVITVCLNSAATIAAAMQSVLDQEYPVSQYIIVDGGSDDGTPEIAASFRDAFSGRLEIITEPERGISRAFNRGIAAASGDIIGILNSDDCYCPDTVRAAVAALQGPEQFVFGDLDFIDREGRVLFSAAGDAQFRRKIATGLPAINHPTLFVRRETYEKSGGYDTRFAQSMDHELLLRLVKHNVPGKYDPRIRARMRLDGRSDRRYLLSLRECRDAALLHGSPRLRVYFRYLYAAVKGRVRRLSERVLPRSLALRLRRLINPGINGPQ